MSPFNAWVFLNGLETLAIRMEVHSQRALDLARWLDAHPAISVVHYPGLETILDTCSQNVSRRLSAVSSPLK